MAGVIGLSLEQIECEYSERSVLNMLMAHNQNNGMQLSQRQQVSEAGFSDEELDKLHNASRRKLGKRIING